MIRLIQICTDVVKLGLVINYWKNGLLKKFSFLSLTSWSYFNTFPLLIPDRNILRHVTVINFHFFVNKSSLELIYLITFIVLLLRLILNHLSNIEPTWHLAPN